IGSMAAPPGMVRRRAIRSVSITTAPTLASIAPTVLLPLPMPPVRPNRAAVIAGTAGSRQAHPAEDAFRSGEQDDQPRAGQKRTERDVAPFPQRGRHLHDDADDGADDRRAEQ